MKIVFSFLAIIGTLSASLHAQNVQASQEEYKNVASTEFPFVKGAREIEFGLGTYWAVDTAGDDQRPDMSFGLAQLLHGWMLTDVRGTGPLRGNVEFLAGVFGGPIWEGPGDGFIGGNLLLRYNFVQPSAQVVPFIQIGGGGVYSDAAKDDEVQRLIGSDWSWDLEGAIGLRWMLSDRFSVSAKAEYKHFSNADSADRNRGLNGIGGVLAASWFF